jgi:hypothetical protein
LKSKNYVLEAKTKEITNEIASINKKMLDFEKP